MPPSRFTSLGQSAWPIRLPVGDGLWPHDKSRSAQQVLYSVFLNMVNYLLMGDKYCTPWPNATHNVWRLVRAYDICPSIMHLFEKWRIKFGLQICIWTALMAMKLLLLDVFQISSHLKSAHNWFRDKFENLQQELVTSRYGAEKLIIDYWFAKFPLHVNKHLKKNWPSAKVKISNEL